MRKSSSAPSFGASGVRHHNLLGYIDLRRELVKIQELAQETTIPTFQLESLQLDPQDSTRAAFHLSCGWSGEGLEDSQPMQRVPFQDNTLLEKIWL